MKSLALLRPQQIEFSWIRKSDSELRSERQKHAALAAQLSFFDATAKPLEPCPLQFHLKWKDGHGRLGVMNVMTGRPQPRLLGFGSTTENEALRILKKKYEEDYFKAGLALAFNTHGRRNITNQTQNQWLLVGIIRVNDDQQGFLDFSVA